MASTQPVATDAVDSSESAESAAEGRRSGGDRGGRRLSLLWWAFLANSSVLVVAFFLLVFSPIEIYAPIQLDQLAVLAIGLVVMLALNVALLRRVLSQFFAFTEAMTSVDPDRPGRRLSGIKPHSREGVALVDAFNRMLDRLETARREAARTALAAQEAERSRIARELHDEIGQTLTAVMLQAERAAAGKPERAPGELAGVADSVRESLDEVRRIARELRPEALDDLGLVSALIALCRRMDAEGGPRVTHDLRTKLPSMAPDVELVIYRVAQEGLTNAVRHADARSVTVSLAADGEAVTLSVRDDGSGMAAKPPAPATAGISGMRERALLVGGRLSIESGPGVGTELRLEVPLDRDDP